MSCIGHVQPHEKKKEEFWNDLSLYADQNNAPRIIMGDFNDNASLEERKGCQSNRIDKILQFKDRWNRCNLLDAGWIGNKFTWVRTQNGTVTLQERQYRLLHNAEIINLFPCIRPNTLQRRYSDHHPILWNSKEDYVIDRNRRPFRFQAMWLTQEHCKVILPMPGTERERTS
ncbi:uncharacterized protein LOC120174167 [Hibiscus syriacus]|uniref:uncharacterized protein LOC120174167 n=1 Tax=Hibiscus syriacus TaxID=106335 RepID=UPI001920BF18|nr:uncharacterized protein LOC120174167 [Hibiscus syriacus]